MPTAKARYKGGAEGAAPREVPPSLIEELRALCVAELMKGPPSPSRGYEGEDDAQARADRLVAAVLTEIRWPAAELHWLISDINRSELRAEHADLRKTLNKAKERLRRLSPDLDRLLGVDADPLGCADSIEALLVHVEEALGRIDSLPAAERIAEKQKAVAVEMAVRVLRVLKNYGLRPAATADPIFGYVSSTVRVLELLGRAAGLPFAQVTWRDVIRDAYRLAPDLQ